MSSPKTFETATNKYDLPFSKNPNCFGSLDYDAYLKTKIHNSNNHVFKFMTIQEQNT